MDAKDLDILMVVWTTVSLGTPLCVGLVCMNLGMVEESFEGWKVYEFYIFKGSY